MIEERWTLSPVFTTTLTVLGADRHE